MNQAAGSLKKEAKKWNEPLALFGLYGIFQRVKSCCNKMNQAYGSIINEEANKSRRLDRYCNNGFQPVEKRRLTNKSRRLDRCCSNGFQPVEKK